MAKMVKRSISFSEPLDEWLKSEAARLGISLADVVRRKLDESRERQETEKTGD